MTSLEIFLLIVLWVIIGAFICYKRDWYSTYDGVNTPPSQGVAIFIAVLFMPINFGIVFFKRMLLEKWDNSNV